MTANSATSRNTPGMCRTCWSERTSPCSGRTYPSRRLNNDSRSIRIAAILRPDAPLEGGGAGREVDRGADAGGAVLGHDVGGGGEDRRREVDELGLGLAGPDVAIAVDVVAVLRDEQGKDAARERLDRHDAG